MFYRDERIKKLHKNPLQMKRGILLSIKTSIEAKCTKCYTETQRQIPQRMIIYMWAKNKIEMIKNKVKQ